ncbi:hypothetical protein [Roseofilum casamattae]|uniref:Uncharacterized protein n=1 Tax=Roseofilum casamattae BLCC-M143 TaxID=3022442 RepID=A0ABT7BV22_9CYAN|nr:hypothetical protein [Roseofilum casamattae]MDJ1183031.1 hypothetical protein [Roseofilum casamattae BLCC-M143]
MESQSASVLSQPPASRIKRTVSLPKLPLAVYREVAAHLRQVDGVNAGLKLRSHSDFDYDLSQIEQMWIEYPHTLPSQNIDRLEQILAYYGDRYGSWISIEAGKG